MESRFSHIVRLRLEAHVSHIVKSRVEGHFLILLGVVGRKTKFPILLGVGVGGESPFSHIVGNRSKFAFLIHFVGNRSKVAFLILLEVMSRGHFSHVGNLKLLFSYCWGWKVTILILLGVGWKRTFLTWFGVGWKVTFSHCWELSGGKSIFPYCWDPVGKVTFSYC